MRGHPEDISNVNSLDETRIVGAQDVVSDEGRCLDLFGSTVVMRSRLIIGETRRLETFPRLVKSRMGQPKVEAWEIEEEEQAEDMVADLRDIQSDIKLSGLP
ncbi:hypothetical protein RUND412_000912 [Rhizina undulata]